METNRHVLQRPPRQKRAKLDKVKCSFCRKAKVKCQPTDRQWPGEKCDRCLQKKLPCSEGQLAIKIRPVLSISQMPSTNQQSQQPAIAPKRMALVVQAQQPPISYSTQPQSQNTDGNPADIHRKWTGYGSTTQPKVSSLRMYFNYEDKQNYEEGNSREALILLSIIPFMNMAIRELKVLADDLASVYQNDPYRTDSTDGLSGLENIFSDINSFAYTLEERALTTGSGKVVSRALIDLHCREIKRAASNALGNVAHYEHFGHYGFAHVLYMETLLSQSTITDDEAHYFIKGRVQFLAETEQVLQQSNWEMWTPMLARLLHSQIFIPRVLLENTVIREHVRELRTPDCLGRSVSHILSDAGHAFEWPVAEAQYVDVLGRSVLYVACSNGNKALATDLIENGRVDTHKALNGLAPLHIAAYMGHASICELICKTCPDIKHHFLDRSGRSPLLWAALRGHLDTVRRLWKLFPSSVLLNIAGNQWIDRDGFGSTALILSSYGGHISVIKYLLARVLPFANFLVNTRDTRGQNAYTYAHQGSHLEIMALLRSYNRLPRKQPVLLDQAASVHLAYLDEFTQEHAMGPVCS